MSELGLFKLEISQALRGDRLILDPQLLVNLEGEISPDTPLIIQIIPADGSCSYGIAWEFTAESGTFKMSQEKAMQITGHDEDYRLYHVSLEKGTFAQLTFLSSVEYSHDYRALLEATLRQKYSTLVLNETISIDMEKEKSKEIKFLVSKLSPADAVLTINTDIEVDIVSSVGVGLDRVMSQNARITLNWNNDVLELVNAKINHPIHIQSKIDKCKPFYKLILTLKEGDVDVFVSSIYEYPDLMHHDYFNVDYGDKNLEFKVETEDHNYLFIGLISNAENELDFCLKVMRSDKPFEAQVERIKLDTLKEGTQQCQNCKSWIPIATLTMHSAFCQRNNILCNKCHLVFKRSDFENHWHCEMVDCDYVGDIRAKEKHHSSIHIPKCCDCGSFYFLNDIATHRKSDCPERKIICGFCHLLVRAGLKSTLAKDLYLGTGISEHESVCGSRTITCIQCQKQVQLKEVQIHAKLHSLEDTVSVLPKVCSNVNCGNTVQSKNSLDLCETCSLGLVGESSIAQKVIETYHSQLTTGCQKSFCQNSKCYTGLGSAKNKIDPMNPTDAALEAISLYKESLGSKRSYYFCVQDDEIVHKRRRVANELVSMGYDLDLCIKGLEENGDDMNDTISWLLSLNAG